MNNKKPPFKTARWIMLSLAVLLNGFLIFYSCLSAEVTASWNSSFTNFFASIINNFTHKEVEKIPLEGIKIDLSKEDKYVYNYIPGYKVDEIPLGSAKQIECTFSPENATDQSIKYVASPAENVVLNQSGSTLSVVGMKVGKCEISAISTDGEHKSKVEIEVVETVAPTKYEISLDKTSIAIGTTQTLKFDIDGGCLGHDELVNFRYFDTRKLIYVSTNESVALVDKYGVIYPQSEGSSNIVVSNGEYVKSIAINVTSGTAPSPYVNLNIRGSDFCYANDMILDQTSKKNHYQLEIYENDTKLSPNDFIWTSSNDLLVKVDNNGVMRGFRKSTLELETAKIHAKSKLTGQIAEFIVTIKNQLPTSMTVVFKIGEKSSYNPTDLTVSIGDEINVSLNYSPYTQTKDVTYTNSNEEIISITNQGGSLTFHVLAEGKTTIKLTSIINPELTLTTNFTVVKAGAINEDNIGDLGVYIRKSLGHAAVFGLAQVFTFLTLFMFLSNKKWWFYSSISLGEGLAVAMLSELIQHFVPSRNGAWIDVLIDFAGVLVGAVLTFLGILIVKKIISKKKSKENNLKD